MNKRLGVSEEIYNAWLIAMDYRWHRISSSKMNEYSIKNCGLEWSSKQPFLTIVDEKKYLEFLLRCA